MLMKLTPGKKSYTRKSLPFLEKELKFWTQITQNLSLFVKIVVGANNIEKGNI